MPPSPPDDLAAPSRVTTSRVDLGIAAALAVLGMLATAWVTTLVGDGRLPFAGDAHYAWLAARSIAFDGDLDLTNQYAQFGDKWGLGRWPASDGTRFPPRELGPSLLMVPGLVLLHALQTWAASFGATSGWLSSPGAEAWLATLPAAASLGPLYLALRRIVSRVLIGVRPNDSADATAAWAVGLSLSATLGFVPPFYAVGHAGYAHAPDAVVCAWLLVAFVERRTGLQMGGLLAVALMMRLQNGLWLLWPLTETIRDLVDARRATASVPGTRSASSRFVTTAAVATAGLSPQVMLAWLHPGSEVGPIRWGLDFFDTDGLANDVVTVLAGVHGLWTWTPLAAVATIGLLLGSWQRTPANALDDPARWAKRAIVVSGLFILLVSLVPDPDGGDAFGARRLGGLTGVLAMGLACLAATVDPPGEASTGSTPTSRAFLAASAGLAAANLVRVALAITGVLSLRP